MKKSLFVISANNHVTFLPDPPTSDVVLENWITKAEIRADNALVSRSRWNIRFRCSSSAESESKSRMH